MEENHCHDDLEIPKRDPNLFTKKHVQIHEYKERSEYEHKKLMI